MKLLLFFLIKAVLANPVDGIPVQDAGRIKPFDSFARETMTLFYGRSSFKSVQQKRSIPASEAVFTMILAPQLWFETKVMDLSHKAVKEALNLPTDEKYFSPKEILSSERLSVLLKDLEAVKESKAKLNGYYQAVSRVSQQLGLFQALSNGKVPGFVPEKDPFARWRTLSELSESEVAVFRKVSSSFVQNLETTEGKRQDDIKKGHEELKSATGELEKLIDSKDLSGSIHKTQLKAEVLNNHMHPFRWAWVVYLFAALAALVSLRTPKAQPWVVRLAVLGFIFHTFGFALRIYITGRPPVSNMYESIVWVSWGTIVFGFILYKMQKNILVLNCAIVGGLVAMLVADSAPLILDKSLQPLEPVLRSNLWLTVHVLTITISYSAFMLSWVIGNWAVLKVLLKKGQNLKPEADLSYRAIQIGVVLLAAGIILGGVWADYSWGRFWGWDPKETWALIALLGYLALLHARLMGLVRDFGILVWSVVSFNLVVMAWYGVNFVLGAGLHSYGFGAGGVEYVATVVIINLALVAVAVVQRRQPAA